MKECPVCKAKNQNDALFCTGCGTGLKNVPVFDGRDSSAGISGNIPYGAMFQNVNSILLDQSEKVVATIGSNYLQNYLSGGGVGKGIGVLTQKRFYYKGKNYFGKGKGMRSATQEGVVSLEDITFTLLTHVRHISLLIFAIILTVLGAMAIAGSELQVCLAFLGAAILFYISYFVTRISVFQVCFPGGGFGFNVRWYPISDIRDFQRQLDLLKDHLKESAET